MTPWWRHRDVPPATERILTEIERLMDRQRVLLAEVRAAIPNDVKRSQEGGGDGRG